MMSVYKWVWLLNYALNKKILTLKRGVHIYMKGKNLRVSDVGGVYNLNKRHGESFRIIDWFVPLPKEIVKRLY